MFLSSISSYLLIIYTYIQLQSLKLPREIVKTWKGLDNEAKQVYLDHSKNESQTIDDIFFRKQNGHSSSNSSPSAASKSTSPSRGWPDPPAIATGLRRQTSADGKSSDNHNKRAPQGLYPPSTSNRKKQVDEDEDEEEEETESVESPKGTEKHAEQQAKARASTKTHAVDKGATEEVAAAAEKAEAAIKAVVAKIKGKKGNSAALVAGTEAGLVAVAGGVVKQRKKRGRYKTKRSQDEQAQDQPSKQAKQPKKASDRKEKETSGHVQVIEREAPPDRAKRPSPSPPKKQPEQHEVFDVDQDDDDNNDSNNNGGHEAGAGAGTPQEGGPRRDTTATATSATNNSSLIYEERGRYSAGFTVFAQNLHPQFMSEHPYLSAEEILQALETMWMHLSEFEREPFAAIEEDEQRHQQQVQQQQQQYPRGAGPPNNVSRNQLSSQQLQDVLLERQRQLLTADAENQREHQRQQQLRLRHSAHQQYHHQQQQQHIAHSGITPSRPVSSSIAAAVAQAQAQHQQQYNMPLPPHLEQQFRSAAAAASSAGGGTVSAAGLVPARAASAAAGHTHAHSHHAATDFLAAARGGVAATFAELTMEQLNALQGTHVTVDLSCLPFHVMPCMAWHVTLWRTSVNSPKTPCNGAGIIWYGWHHSDTFVFFWLVIIYNLTIHTPCFFSPLLTFVVGCIDCIAPPLLYCTAHTQMARRDLERDTELERLQLAEEMERERLERERERLERMRRNM
jgi:hypothetical protein